jgi:polysaccharide biosynthesis/export protein
MLDRANLSAYTVFTAFTAFTAILLGSSVPAQALSSTAFPPANRGPAIGANASVNSSLNSSAPTDGYLLGAGDRVRVDFFNVPEFSGEFGVLPNGTVNLPNIGAVNVQGRSLIQASDVIADRAKVILKRTVVTVSLVTPRPVNIAIAGEVNRPGAYTLSLNPVNGEVTVPKLTKVLQLAEGVTQSADLRRVQVRRVFPGREDVINTVTVDLWKLLNAGDNRQDIRLQDGDSIYIPPVEAISLNEARQLSSASFASKRTRPLQVIVVGQVNRPGPYTIAEYSATEVAATSSDLRDTPVSRVPSVTQAIQQAGGITQLANVRQIQVKRLTKTGEEKSVNIDFWNLLTQGDARQDLPLQDGDTIVVPEATNLTDGEATQLAKASFSPDKIAVNVVGAVEKPGTVSVPPNTPLNQALLAAGGFNKDARKSRVTLVRLNPNGTVDKRDVQVFFQEGLNEGYNPAMRNNDTIIVDRTGFAKVTGAIAPLLSPLGSLFSIFNVFKTTTTK